MTPHETSNCNGSAMASFAASDCWSFAPETARKRFLKIVVAMRSRFAHIEPMKTNNNEARYEILDSMEVKVATADSLDDAMFAAEKYAPAMVVKVATGKVVWTA